MIARRGSYFAGGGLHFDCEEGIILSLDEGCILNVRRGHVYIYFRWTRGNYILISRGLLPPLEEGHIRSNGVELAVADRSMS